MQSRKRTGTEILAAQLTVISPSLSLTVFLSLDMRFAALSITGRHSKYNIGWSVSCTLSGCFNSSVKVFKSLVWTCESEQKTSVSFSLLVYPIKMEGDSLKSAQIQAANLISVLRLNLMTLCGYVRSDRQIRSNQPHICFLLLTWLLCSSPNYQPAILIVIFRLLLAVIPRSPTMFTEASSLILGREAWR